MAHHNTSLDYFHTGDAIRQMVQIMSDLKHNNKMSDNEIAISEQRGFELSESKTVKAISITHQGVEILKAECPHCGFNLELTEATKND